MISVLPYSLAFDIMISHNLFGGVGVQISGGLIMVPMGFAVTVISF
jgi:hypothetical protein